MNFRGYFVVAEGHTTFYSSPFDPLFHQLWSPQGLNYVDEGHQSSAGARKRGREHPKLLLIEKQIRKQLKTLNKPKKEIKS